MKKVILFALLIFAAVFVSCEKGSSVKYTVSQETLTDDLSYGYSKLILPVLSGTANDKFVNRALEEAVVAILQDYLMFNYHGGYFKYTIDSLEAAYTGKKLASFLFVGSYSDDDSSHPETIVYTININPETGKIYTFEELIADFDLLAEKFKAGKFKLVAGIDDLLEKTNYQDMFIEYNSLYGIYPPLYFIGKETGTELAFSVGLVYTLGGHAEFSIEADSVKNAMTDTLSELLY